MKLPQEDVDKIGESPSDEERVKFMADLANLENQIKDLKRSVARAQSMRPVRQPKPEREPGIITEFFRLLF